MTAPIDEKSNSRGDASEPADLQDYRERLAFIGRRAWAETRVTALAVWGQLHRLFTLVRAWWTGRKLERRYLAAQIALGEQVDAATLGDAALRTRLADLRERRRSFQAARESTRALDTEIRGLHVRLAEPFLESVQAPAAVEPQHRRALAMRMDIADRRAHLTEQRAQLFPTDSETRIRTAAGLGALAVLLTLVWSLFSGGETVTGVLLAPVIDLENLQPLAAFPVPDPPADGAATGAVETRTFDVAADALLPARKVSVTLVNGRPSGEVRSVDDQGRLICIERYRAGVLNGMRERFYPDGKKFSELRFVDGVAQNEELIWFPDQTPASKTTIVDGVPHGPAVIYFANGRKCVSTPFVQGRPHGQRSHFRPDDVCFAIVEWRDGQPVSQQFLQVEVSPDDIEAIEQRGGFSTRLVDHWGE